MMMMMMMKLSRHGVYLCSWNKCIKELSVLCWLQALQATCRTPQSSGWQLPHPLTPVTLSYSYAQPEQHCC
jgi:hypothetical protein